MAENWWIIILNFNSMVLHTLIHPKDADRMVNSVNPDQTAPLSPHCLPDLSVNRSDCSSESPLFARPVCPQIRLLLWVPTVCQTCLSTDQTAPLSPQCLPALSVHRSDGSSESPLFARPVCPQIRLLLLSPHCLTALSVHRSDCYSGSPLFASPVWPQIRLLLRFPTVCQICLSTDQTAPLSPHCLTDLSVHRSDCSSEPTVCQPCLLGVHTVCQSTDQTAPLSQHCLPALSVHRSDYSSESPLYARPVCPQIRLLLWVIIVCQPCLSTNQTALLSLHCLSNLSVHRSDCSSESTLFARPVCPRSDCSESTPFARPVSSESPLFARSVSSEAPLFARPVSSEPPLFARRVSSESPQFARPVSSESTLFTRPVCPTI